MKVLIYSPVFFPMVGGMETVSQCISELLVNAGHECKLVTPVQYDQKDNFIFPVYRKPALLEKIKLILWADIVFVNGASLAIFPLAKLLFKPFVWKHAGYQASCVDGLGWVDGKSAPMTPWASVKFHYRRSGWYYAAKEAAKLFMRRLAAKHMVNMNIAITDWVAYRQPFNKQIKIYNPSPLARFERPSSNVEIKYDFVYMGRLVSEKGLNILIHAFNEVFQQSSNKISLLIIGEGPIRKELEELVNQLQLNEYVTFAGRRIGQELTDMIHSASIAVVPSEWEEPMGIVAIEMMAAGRNIIVSELGGLKECVGEAGLTFPNGDHRALAGCMLRLLNDPQLASRQKEIAREQLKKFDPADKGKEYIRLFDSIINS